ncbi:MAG: hypothetical protein JRH20_24385, partial [Deltaproteobacteria bacterium]|nr:hypothetical protein [Deltaproteobacteria bacterium]
SFRPSLSTTGANAEATNIRVIANVIKGGNSALAFVGCVSCLVANNTILDPTDFPLRILQESVTGDGWTFAPCGDGRVLNNIIFYTVDSIDAYVNVGDDTAPKTFVFTNNLWYARDWPAFSEPQQLPVNETYGVYGVDPLFGGEASDDYTITGTGGAAFMGSNVAEIGADYQGLCYRTPPSIGAFEVP